APGADDRAIRQLEVLDLALDRVIDGRAGPILADRLDRDEPLRRIERRLRDLDVIRARIDDAGNVLAVPVENDEHVLAVHLVSGPGAEPRALDRMTFLGGGRARRDGNEREGSQPETNRSRGRAERSRVLCLCHLSLCAYEASKL